LQAGYLQHSLSQVTAHGGDDFDSPFEIAPHRTAWHRIVSPARQKTPCQPGGLSTLAPCPKTQAMIRRRSDVALLRIPPFQIFNF
jgi:hypothetical protein